MLAWSSSISALTTNTWMISLSNFLLPHGEHNQRLLPLLQQEAAFFKKHNSHWSSSSRGNENVPESRSVSCWVRSSPVQCRWSVTGVLAVGAVAHVFGVELHLDGDAVETKLCVEQIGGLLQHRLSICTLLWEQKQHSESLRRYFIPFFSKISILLLLASHIFCKFRMVIDQFVISPMARWTDTSAWPKVRAQRCRQWIDFTAFTDTSTSFTELNSIPLGDPEKQQDTNYYTTMNLYTKYSLL